MKKFLKRIPWWGYVLGGVLFGAQYGIYRLANLIATSTNTISWAFCPKIDVIDNLIPITPIFVVIYIYSYLFWIMGPIAVSLTKKSNVINFTIGLVVALFIGALIFIFAPTYMDRDAEELMVQAQKPGFFNFLLGIVYGNDGGSYGFNLFPSYHCLFSFYCYLGIRKKPEIKKWFKIYSLIMVVLICLSTVFTKQHYFIDIIGGLGIAFIVWLITEKINPGEKIVQKHHLKEEQ